MPKQGYLHLHPEARLTAERRVMNGLEQNEAAWMSQPDNTADSPES
jgi:hypothetical protein